MTGGDVPGHHVVDLVAGRDFTPDGTIEAAEVRDGDPCPNCEAGVLATARGIEMGHIFQLGRKFADALDLQVLDENGKLVTVTMGSYGIGVSRAVAAIAEGNNDELGLCWPREISPADVHLVATGKDEAVYAEAERSPPSSSDTGLDVIFDDRPRRSARREVQGLRADRRPDHRRRRSWVRRRRRSRSRTAAPAIAPRSPSPTWSAM